MAHAHEVHGSVDGTGAGFLSGFTLAIAALILALVVGGIVLLATQPWDHNGGSNGITNNNSVPANNQPANGGNTSGGANQPAR